MSNYGLRILSVRCAVRRLEQCTVVEVWEWANRWCACSRQTVLHYLSRMAASGEIKRIGINQYGALCLLLVFLTGCGLKYAGTNAGLQTVSPFSRMRVDEHSASFYTISYGPIGDAFWHVQPIIPMDGSDPLLGVGVDVPIPFLTK